MIRKLDTEHLDEIQSLRDGFANNTNILGQISIELHVLEQQKLQLQQDQNKFLREFELLQETESALIQKMRERYGDGQINVVDGTFTPDDGLVK
jgi:hypothetical protein